MQRSCLQRLRTSRAVGSTLKTRSAKVIQSNSASAGQSERDPAEQSCGIVYIEGDDEGFYTLEPNGEVTPYP